MSISELFEPNYSNLYCSTVTATDGVEGPLGVIQYAEEAAVGPLTTVTKDITISETLYEGDVYLFMWQCIGGNADTGHPWLVTITYDASGQNDTIGTSGVIDVGQWTTDNMGFSGFRVLTIDSDGAGNNKKINFSATGETDKAYIGQMRIVMIPITIS